VYLNHLTIKIKVSKVRSGWYLFVKYNWEFQNERSWILKVLLFFLGGWYSLIAPTIKIHPNAWDSGIRYLDLFAFTIPEQPIIWCLLWTQPLASESAWFSDAFDYSIAVRRASIGGTGSQAEFTTGEQEFRFTCNFKPPDAGRAQMTGTARNLQGPSSISVPVTVNDEDTQVPGARLCGASPRFVLSGLSTDC